MALTLTGLVFFSLLLLSMPIIFALGAAAAIGLIVGGYPLEVLAGSVISGAQSWVLLAIPSFIFAGLLMERCGMSHTLVDLARAMVGWLPGGLGMSVVAVSYLFSDLCGSIIAEVSTLSSVLMKPMRSAGYKAEDAASLVAAGASMGMLVPPAIFMIVIAVVTNVSPVALFLAGFIPAAVMAVCLCTLVLIKARKEGWPRDVDPSFPKFLTALRAAIVPLMVPFLIFGGLYSGAFTTTEAGAVVALFSIVVARFYYRNVSWRDIFDVAYDSGILTGAVIFLTAVATIYQYLLGVTGVPKVLSDILLPLQSAPWLFLIGVAAITMLIGMVLEGLPAAVLFVPVVYPIAVKLHIDPIHFCIVQTAAVGVGLFMPPLGIGLLVALRFAKLNVLQHAPHYWPYATTLVIGLLLIIFFPEISLILPRSAGFIR
jgi:tripartite ATP-independent transporter DctM subunit